MSNHYSISEVIAKALELAVLEINKYGAPKIEQFDIANIKGQQLAVELKADKDIVLLGTMLMDLKIGQCIKENRLLEHVQESVLAAQEFLKQFNLTEEVYKKIISCIESHHGVTNYFCLEAEICANADCYRFLSPAGFFHGFMVYNGRGLNFQEVLAQLEKKIEEKHNILSLNICRAELEDYYLTFKKLIREAR